MNEKVLNTFLKSLSSESEYRFLEQGKDDEELKAVCEKRGIQFPNPDLSILKMVYAYIDKMNLNGCTLPKEEVEKSVNTIVGKAIDFDHIRDRVVGWMIDAEIVDDKIIAYGAFFKSSLGDDYDLIRELFNRKNLAVSLEAWGEREFNSDGTYNLKDIIFCGLALLINTKPAFPGAGVFEMANKKMEFASLDDKTDFIKKGDKVEIMKQEEIKIRKLEESRFWASDFDTILRMRDEVVCPLCKNQGLITINVLDFEKNEMKGNCWACDSDLDIKLSPRSTVIVKDVATREVVEVTEAKKQEGDVMKVNEKSSDADELIKSEEETPAEDIQTTEQQLEEVVEEVEEEVKEEEKVEEKKEEVVKEEEVVKIKDELEILKVQLSKARDEGKVIGERRGILGDYAKDMSDDDVLDEVKYENATLKMKLAKLEESKKETASVKSEVVLDFGAKDVEREVEITQLGTNVRKRAFNL